MSVPGVPVSVPGAVDIRCEYLNSETPCQYVEHLTLGVSTLTGKPDFGTINSRTRRQYQSWESPRRSRVGTCNGGYSV